MVSLMVKYPRRDRKTEDMHLRIESEDPKSYGELCLDDNWKKSTGSIDL
jgi:hypothetical protein